MSDNATWQVWGSYDPAEEPRLLLSDLVREVAVRQVDHLHAQGHANAHAVDTAANDDSDDTDEPDDRGTPFYDGPVVTVDGFESLLNLPSVEKFRTGEDGTLVAVHYNFAPGYQHQNGAVLDFQLPDGRVVRVARDGDGGLDFMWRDGGTQNMFGDLMLKRAEGLDDGAIEVLHLMHDEIDSAFDRLLRQFFVAACTNVRDALTTTGDTPT